MKNGLAVVSVVVVLYTGCVSRPKWVMDPPYDEVLIFGMGVADQMTSEALAWETATSRARENLSFQIKAIVTGIQIDYANTNPNSRNEDFFKTMSRQLSDVVLEGAQVVKREVKSNNRYYVLVSYRKSAMKQAVASYAQVEGNRNPAFQADEAIKNMNVELEKLRSDAVRVQNAVNAKQQAEWQKWKTELEQEQQRQAAQQARLEQELQQLKAALERQR